MEKTLLIQWAINAKSASGVLHNVCACGPELAFITL